MRKALALVVASVAVVALPLSMPVASADDPQPVIIVDPPPFAPGADLMIRPADRSQGFIGMEQRGPGQVVAEHTLQFQRAAATLKVCNVGARRTMRVHGSNGGLNWRLRYFVGTHNVTRAVTHGTYWTPRLADGKCVRMRMTARLEFGAGDYDETFRVVAVPRVGARDAVSLSVHIDGVIVVP